MKKQILLFSLLGLVLSCSAQEKENSPASAETPAPTSRIRMFGQNAATALLFRNSACVKSIWSDDAEKVSGGMGSAFSSFLGMVSNTSLGIAETPSSRNLSAKDGIFSKAYFREYLIPANKPASLKLGFRDISTFYSTKSVGGERIILSAPQRHCQGAITFMPLPGADYEAGFTHDDKACVLQMNQVVVKEGEVELIPVPVTLAPECDAKTAEQ